MEAERYKERFMYLTVLQGKSKKKTIVSIGRRMAELMYSVLRNKTVYELRQWKCPKNKTVQLVEKVLCA
jgi:hypothetical protein